MSTQRPDGPEVRSTGESTAQTHRRGFLAGLSALVAGGLGLFATQTPARADDDDGWDDGGWDDDGWDDDDGWYDGYYYGGYYYPGYYPYYYDPYYDDDDDWGDWDD